MEDKKKIDFIEVLRRWGIGEANSREFGIIKDSSVIRNNLKENNLYYLIPLLKKRYPLINYIYNLNAEWILQPFDFIYNNFEKINTIETEEWKTITNGTFKLNDALNHYLNWNSENNRVRNILENFYNLSSDDLTGLILIKNNLNKYTIIEGNSRLVAIYKYYRDGLDLSFLKDVQVILGYINLSKRL